MDPERRRRLVALGKLHEAWTRRHEKDQDVIDAFDPSKRKPGSDYNLHNVTMDTSAEAQDEFHEAARKIMRDE